MNSLTRHPIEFFPLTALHVGGGVTLEPYEYIVRNGHVLRLSYRKLLAHFGGKGLAEPFALAAASDISGAVRLIEENFSDEFVRARFPVSEGFEDYWRHRLTSSIESLELTLFPETTTGFYLPGSSLKGSIRTAYYAVLGQAAKYPPEWDVFGHKRYPVDSSPFKRLKVLDIDLGMNVEVAPVHGIKIADWSSGAPEVVKLLLRGNLEHLGEKAYELNPFEDFSRMPAKFSGAISFFDGYPGQEVVSLQSLIAHTRSFAAAQIQYEMQKPNIGPFYQWMFQALAPAMQRPDTTLVRVGFGGGRLATSVLAFAPEVIAEELAAAKFALSRDPHPKVRKIAGRYPMGWALIRFAEAKS